MKRTISLLALASVVAGSAACGDDDSATISAGGTSSEDASTSSQERRYEFAGTVLEDVSHGPELCFSVEESLPPQCGDVPIEGWSWDGVPGVQSRAGTTWAEVRVVGTFDGTTFTPVEDPTELTDPSPPAGPDPDLSALCAGEVVDAGRLGRENFEAAASAAQALPNQAAVWVDDAGPSDEWVLNVVVTEDAAGAEASLRDHWGGRLCIERRDQPSEAELRNVQSQVQEELDDVFWSSIGVDTRAGKVRVSLPVATPELQDRVDERFGPGLVELVSLLRPVD
jgi:hypothetical protein